MKIETKVVVSLEKGEKVAIQQVYKIMVDIMGQTCDTNAEIYDVANQVCDALDAFENLVDTKIT